MNQENKLSHYINTAKSLDINKYEKKLRIAILGSFTLNGLAEVIQVKCSDIKVGCTVYVSNYNQYNQDILNDSSDLYKFSPNITFLILDTQSILGNLYYFPYSIDITQRKNYIEEKLNELKNLINIFVKRSNSKLIISNFVIPSYSPYGIYDSKMDYGIKEMITDLNSKLNDYIKNQNSVYCYDLNGFVTRYGQNNTFDYHKYFFGDIKIAFDYIPYLAHDLISYVKSITSINKKCIVLDLDHTLWGGIVGEDGFEGIKLGPTPPGNAYVEFQKRLLALHQRGIILAINSKNNEQDALDVIRKHPHMILKEEHFACMKINWNDKLTNMKEIVNELNIGLDSVMFIDDDPVNRELIHTTLPQILTIDMGTDPVNFAPILMEMNDFDSLQITDDDLRRGKMYLEDKNRKTLLGSVSNLDDFLKQLDIKIEIKNADEFSIPRISQLTLKTNQFNLTTKRYQEEEIRKFVNDKKMLVECAQVKDKFGDNGITGVSIVKKEDSEWIIDTFLMSCRIMGRRIEDGILSSILQRAKEEGVKKIKALFIQTSKNQPIANFLPDYGFVKEGDYWVFSLENDIKTPKHLKIERK
jgi:FkbH-like protein